MAGNTRSITEDLHLRHVSPVDHEAVNSAGCERLPSFLRIRLTPDTTPLHFAFYLLASLLTISFFVFINSTQPFVLHIILKVLPEEQGNINGSLLFYDQLLSIALMGLWGALSDLAGRRVVFVLGFLLMGIALLCFTLARTVFPELLLVRLFFAVGAAASSSMVTAVLADYVGEKDKGKVSATVGLTSGFGAMLGAFVLLGLPTYVYELAHQDEVLALQFSYYIVGGTSIVVAIILAFTLKPRSIDMLSIDFWQTHVPIFFSYFKNANPRQSNNEFIVVSPDEPQSVIDSKDHLIPVGHPSGSNTSASQQCPFLRRQDVHDLHEVDESSYLLTCPESSPHVVHHKNQPEAGGCLLPGVLEQTSVAKSRGFWRLVWKGLALAVYQPYILFGYMGGFVARGDSIIITLFLPLWINAYYQQHGLCSVTPGGLSNSTSVDVVFSGSARTCNDAYRKAQTYSGVAQTFALLGAPLFGFIASRFQKRRAVPLLIASIVSFVGYFAVFFVQNPVEQSAIVFPLMCLIGIGEIGMIITSLSLVTSNVFVNPEIRGSVAGCYSLVGVLGILISTKLGGILFDAWTYTAPFLVMSLLAGVTVLVGLAVSTHESIRQRHHEAMSLN